MILIKLKVMVGWMDTVELKDLTFVMRSLARLSNRCSSFCVSTGMGDSSSQIILFLSSLDRIMGSSLTSFQNSLTVFLLFFEESVWVLFIINCCCGGGTGLFGVLLLLSFGDDLMCSGDDLRFTPNSGGGTAGKGGGALHPGGGGGGARPIEFAPVLNYKTFE